MTVQVYGVKSLKDKLFVGRAVVNCNRSCVCMCATRFLCFFLELWAILLKLLHLLWIICRVTQADSFLDYYINRQKSTQCKKVCNTVLYHVYGNES